MTTWKYFLNTICMSIQTHTGCGSIYRTCEIQTISALKGELNIKFQPLQKWYWKFIDAEKSVVSFLYECNPWQVSQSLVLDHIYKKFGTAQIGFVVLKNNKVEWIIMCHRSGNRWYMNMIKN